MMLLSLSSKEKLRGLFALVFFTGAAVLVVEITATRILSPEFGNTIYTVSSVIGVILGALSCGYWRGGILADRRPTIHEFFRVIYKGGIALLVMYVLAYTLLPVGGLLTPITWGPLLWSIILFFPPSYFLGMLSPFAIKLAGAYAPEQGLGRLSGSIFFWSTVGSITGSLATGFFFIPHLGVSTIMLSTTVLVLLVGAGGMIKTGNTRWKERLVMLLFLCTILLVVAHYSDLGRAPEVLYAKDGTYERVVVVDGLEAGKPARFFLQDKSTSGAIFRDNDEHVFTYTKYYSLYKLWKPELASALFIGGGVATMPRALNRERPDAIVDIVEIEPELEMIAKTYFRLPDTPNIRTHIGDGRRYLADTKSTYDFISSDVYYSLFSIPSHFTTKEFFKAAKARLNQGGIFFANIIGTPEKHSPSLVYSEVRTMREVFDHVYLFTADAEHGSGIQNLIMIGVNGNFPLQLTSPLLSESTDPTIRELPKRLVNLDDVHWEDYPILTDDYAPVEYLVSRFMGASTAGGGASAASSETTRFINEFGEAALGDVKNIVNMGTRAIGTGGNARLRELLGKQLEVLGFTVVTDAWDHVKRDGTKVRLANVIGRLRPELPNRIILGTHFDSIMTSYRDKTNPHTFMPGANNGASGVSVLLQAAKILSVRPTDYGVDIVFFDGEEGENALGAGDHEPMVPLGSTHFATQLPKYYPNKPPEEAIIFNMVCDKKLKFKRDSLSYSVASTSVDRFWSLGKEIAPNVFSDTGLTSIYDDHTPLIHAGIPSFLVIDFEYEPWFNTREDTPDKCSAESLGTVGATLFTYLLTRNK